MHDIGKIGISECVLYKPGKLSKPEYEIMKSHTQIGSDILAGARSEVLQLAQEIALSHHERWDGQGYPNGLSGGIPSGRQNCRVRQTLLTPLSPAGATKTPTR